MSDERGQASVELVGMLWLLLLVALAVWQLLLAAWAAEQAQNAARTASRVEGRGGDAGKSARYALSAGLRHGMTTEVRGESVTVSVRVPILIPGLDAGDRTPMVHRTATLPSTEGTS